MKNSGFILKEAQQTRFAVGYTYWSRIFSVIVHPTGIYQFSSIRRTLLDAGRYCPFYFFSISGSIGHNGKVLSGDGLRFMRTPQTMRSPESHDTYGIGWAMYEYDGHQVMGHAGPPTLERSAKNI